MKYYAISEEVLKYVLTYLMQRPYSEVADAIQVLSSIPEIKVQEATRSETANPESDDQSSAS